MKKEKQENIEDNNWPKAVSGSTLNYATVNFKGIPIPSKIGNVFECMRKLAEEFNLNYSVNEKLISVVTETGGYDYGGSNVSYGTVAFHVTSMETNKTRRLMNLEILNQTKFNVELSIYTDSGRFVIGKLNSCSKLRECFIETLKDERITKQLQSLRGIINAD